MHEIMYVNVLPADFSSLNLLLQLLQQHSNMQSEQVWVLILPVRCPNEGLPPGQSVCDLS